MTLTSGSRLGPYEILGPLGSGGMGEVYRARDPRLEREVAVKVLPEAVADDPERLRRFEREAKAAGALNHPNILAVYDIGSHEGRSYVVTELLEGETLRQRLESEPCTARKIVEWAIQIAHGLAAAHGKGIVHRDLKPENLFLTRDGVVKILDFGLAKVAHPSGPSDASAATLSMGAETEPGTVLGTVGYMAPEQVRGQMTDHRADIFAFGAVLYEALAGERAFKGDSAVDILSAILKEDPPELSAANHGVPPALASIVRRCLEKRPEERFQSAHDLALALEAAATPSEAVGESPAPSVRRRAALALTGLALVVLLGVFLTLTVGDFGERFGGGSAAGKIDSLAVLPLANLSGDPEQTYFADGMTEALIADLAKIRALTVISRTSVMRYKGTTTPLPQIAAELNVDAVVEGSVLCSGDRVRITAQLIEGATDRHLWAESYERDLTDVLALQGEVARAIAREIHVALTPLEQERLAGGPRVDPEAYKAYLIGYHHMQKQTTEGGRAAVRHFQAAIARDPDNALALAGLAEAYAGWKEELLPSGQWETLAEAAALRALEIDDTLAEAHLALGVVRYWAQFDWAGAAQAYEKAIELNPGLAEARHNYGHYLWLMGRTDEALAELERYLELDPLSPNPSECLAWHYAMARQYDLAIEFNERVLELDPKYFYAHIGLGDAYLWLGRFEEAAVAYRTAQALSAETQSRAPLSLAYLEAVSGNRQTAGEMLHLLEEEGANISPAMVAAVHGALDNEDEAFAWLEEAYRRKDYLLTYIKVHPFFDPLRDDPRFHDLLRRMNLPA